MQNQARFMQNTQMSPIYHQQQQQQQQQRYMSQQAMNQPPPQAMNQNQPLFGQQGGQPRFWMQQNSMNQMAQQNSDMLFNNSQQMQPEMAPHDQLSKYCENL